jgi:hypothetical protein
MRDIMGAGGNVYRGMRTVRKGGFLKFDGSTFQSDDLLPYVGDRVYVYNNGKSCFSAGPIIVSHDFYYNKSEICTINESEYLKSKKVSE